MNSIQKLCEKLWQFENEFDLLDMEIQGVKVWQYMRMQIYYAIAEKSGIFQTPHAQKKTIYGQLKKSLTYIKGLIFYNPFLIFNQNVDEIVIEHPRPKHIDGEDIDIYTQYYLNQLDKSGQNYLVLERPFLNEFHGKTYTPHRKYLDAFIVMSAIRAKLFPARLDGDEKKLIKKLEQELKEQFEVDINLTNILTAAVTKFQSNYGMYQRLFSKFQPEKLVVAVSYAYGDAIKAAKDMGIETVEIQHGTFSKYHLGYSFPDRVDDLDYFPDKFLAWGEYWKNLNVIPLSKKTILITGFTHFNSLREMYKDLARKQHQVLVLSQGALGPQIADKILEQIDSLKGCSLVYKLHPGEYSRWNEYSSLVRLSELPNVEIVEDEDIYKLFAESSFQVGVFSTALYEGLGFDCKTILLELPGIEYMADLIKNDTVEVLKKDEDILNVMERFSQGNIRRGNISNRVFAN